MRSALLHAFNIITELGSDVLRKHLRVLSRLEILLTVQKPERNLELTGRLNDSNQLFNLIGRQFTGSLVNIHFRLLANKVRETTSDTRDLRQTEHDITLSLNVSVENTQNVLEFRSLDQRARPEQQE